MKKTRDSNIELLRILAMIMIIAGHFAAHGIFKVNAPNPYSIFPVGSFSNKVITVLLVPGGKVGVALFFMISGFFGIDRKKAPDLTKTISTVFFYAACLFVLSLVLRVAHTVDVSLGMILTAGQSMILPVSSNSWWFVTTYIVLMLVSHTLNNIIISANKRGYFFLFLYFGIALGIVGIGTPYYDLIRAPLYYLIGAFIKKKGIQLKSIISISITIASFFTGWLLYSALTIKYINSLIGNVGSTEGISYIVDLIRIGIIIPVVSTSLFLLVESMTIKSKTINRFASRTFAVYLLHDSHLGRYIIWNLTINFQDQFLQLGGVEYTILIILTVIIVFVTCALIDFVRVRVVDDHYQACIDKAKLYIKNNFTEKKEQL